MGQFYDDEICKDTLTYYPIGQYIPGIPNDIGIISALCGVLNIVMSLVTVMWIKIQEREAQADNGREEAVKSVIFPVFVKVLWASAIVNIYAGVVTAFVPLNAVGNNSFIISAVYAVVWALQHAVLEGIAFLLMQKGCGKHAARRAGVMAGIWAAITFVIMLIIFDRGGRTGDIMEIVWDAVMILFYCALWLAPQKRFFRRPAAILYARFWFGYRLVVVCTNILLFFPTTSNLGSCGYILATVILFAVFQPLICYWTLLQDSRWWQGLDIDQGRRYESNEDIRSPLVGSDFSLFSAQSLAESMDHMRVHGQVKMLNFACIKLDHRKHLGAGSFSKVYRGTYRGKECAIKLIYTVDLTADVIKRVAAEASILSSIRHPNIVHIYGVSVLPPSVCLILELCSFGSLSDIIRGYGFDWNTSHRAPLDLSRTDSLYLALGCAKGLAAVHAYDSSICHRDVKSFNFLVDYQFNVKIADLELGIANSESSGHSIQNSIFRQEDDETRDVSGLSSMDPELVAVEQLLANWMAPEVLRNCKFQQASDIYSLGSVMWEIISGQLPFDADSQAEIRAKILSGYRHPIPPQFKGSAIATLITRCWDEEPSRRPLGDEVVAEIEHILSDQCYGLVGQVESVPNTTALRDFYEQHFRQSNNSSVYSDGHHPRQSMSFTSIFSRFNPVTTVQSDRVQQESTDRSSTSNVSGDRGISSESISNLHAPLLFGGEMDPSFSHDTINYGNRHSNERSKSDADGAMTRRKQRESKSYFSNNMYSLRMQAQMPRAALDAIGLVKEEGYWRHLEAHGGAWAVVTVESPHLVLHATSSWYRMFDINPSTISYTRLESLVSLMGTYRTAYVAASGNAAAFSASNNYVNFTNMEDNENAVNEILSKLEANQQAHGVASFHLPPNAEAVRQVGHNMMCTLHAYPIYSPKAWAQMDAAANCDTPSKKSFSLRQTFSNMAQTGRASFASTSAAKHASYSDPVAIDGATSLDSVTNSSNDMASFSPTDYMRNSVLAEETRGPNYSPSVTKPRLVGGSFSLRSNMTRHIKPLESVTPLYFAVLFNEMAEQAPLLKPSPHSTSSVTNAGSGGTRSRGNSTSSNGETGSNKGAGATSFFPKFRSFIGQPSAQSNRNSVRGESDGDSLLDSHRSTSMA